MNIAGYLFLLLVHYLSGNGLINLFSIRLSRTANIALSFICGVMVASFVPFALQLCYVSITLNTVGIALVAITVLLNIKRLVKRDFTRFNFTITTRPLYELGFMLFAIFLMIPSLWKCFYLPPYARDILSGPEIVATYTVKEHTMLNSVLKLNLESTNNHLKPPFVTDLQIVYKLFVQPFGQMWLSVIVISFLVWLYSILKEKLHPVLAGTLLILFISIPDLYAYSYVILFDYCNMVLFFAGVYFLSTYITKGESNILAFSILMFGFATFIRSETLVLVCMLLPLLIYNAYTNKRNIVATAVYSTAFIAVPYFFYFIWIEVFLKHYMPSGFSVSNEINKNLGNISVFYTRFSDMLTSLMYGGDNINHFGYFINIFTVFFLSALLVKLELSLDARIYLYTLGVLFIGLPFLGYLLPLFDLENTTKRGIFKMLPLMVLLLRDNILLQRFSTTIYNWEDNSYTVSTSELKTSTRKRKTKA